MANENTWAVGIGWESALYRLAVLDVERDVFVFAATYPSGAISELMSWLRTATNSVGRFACVIDTTSGVLEHYLVGLGVELYRADPSPLLPRSAGSSADPRDLARFWRDGAGRTTLLTVRSGGLSGREGELRSGIAEAHPMELRRADQGRWLDRGDPRKRQVALTFDDGPSRDFTPRVLDALGHAGATATFFCLGLHVEAHPDIVRRIAAEGHRLGNHTWSHPYLPDLSTEEIRAQVSATREALRRTGTAPSRLFRPPYGGRDARTMRALADADLVDVLWDVDAMDWAQPGSRAITDKVIRETRNGSVVLLHDGGAQRSQTVDALPDILKHLRSEDYELVPVDALQEV